MLGDPVLACVPNVFSNIEMKKRFSNTEWEYSLFSKNLLLLSCAKLKIN